MHLRACPSAPRQRLGPIHLGLAALVLLAPGAVRSEPSAMAGPSRVKLRTGRVLEATAVTPLDGAQGRWTVDLEGGGSLVLPAAEIRLVEPDPGRVLAVTAPLEVAVLPAPAPDGALALEAKGCDPSADPRLSRWDALTEDAAQRHGLDPALVQAIIAVESCGNPKAVSPKGAVGLMQLLPSTAADYGVRDLRDPAKNIDAGCRHLARLHLVVGPQLDHVVAAYNAGEGVVRRVGGVPKYRETRNYVKHVLGWHDRLTATAEPARAAL